MHWTDITAAPETGRTGRLATSDTDPFSGQPGFKDTPARIARAELAWRGFLVTRTPLASPACEFWVRSRLEHGWLYEIGGMGEVDAKAFFPPGPFSEVAYPAKGMQRLALCDDAGFLTAALFITRKGTLPPREWIAAQLGKEVADPVAMLAGRPREPGPDRGAIVCVCHDVGEREIAAAIAGGAASVGCVGAATRAGTNCGSCRPYIARMIEHAQLDVREAAE